MGCDIHMYAEVLDDSGKWRLASKIKRRHEVSNGFWEPGSEVGKKNVLEPVWDGRSYDTFAILANVRNGHGFAGIKTSEGFNFIAEPRGLPDDMSDALREATRRGGSGITRIRG